MDEFGDIRYLDPQLALEIQPLIGQIQAQIFEAGENFDLLERLNQEGYEAQKSASVALRGPEPTGLVADIFSGMVRGENAEAFTVLEEVVNRMRTTGSTKHLGLFGPASSGKTVSAQRVAKALGREFRLLDAESLTATGAEGIVEALKPPSNPRALLKDLAWQVVLDTEQSLLQLVLSPLVLFIDEAHRLPASTQAALLTMMAGEQTLRIPNGALNFRNVCFILATTDPSQLIEPLKTRTLEVEFNAYSIASVAEIVSTVVGVSSEVALRIAAASRGVPRRALNVADALGENATEDTLRAMFGIDSEGMDKTDRQILDILKSNVQRPSPLKLREAELLVAAHADNRRVSEKMLAQAQALLSVQTVPKPMSRRALADALHVQDLGALERRISELRSRGLLYTTTQGVLYAQQDIQ